MRLLVRFPDGREERLSLDRERPLQLGSSRRADVVCTGEDVASSHVALMWKHERFELRVAKSASPISFNGTDTTRAELKAGDRFRLGKTEFSILPAADEKPTKRPVAKSSIPAQRDAPPAEDDDELGLAPLADEPRSKQIPAETRATAKPANTKPTTHPVDEELGLAALADEPRAKQIPAETRVTAKPANTKPATRPVDEELGLAPLADEPRAKQIPAETRVTAKPATPPGSPKRSREHESKSTSSGSRPIAKPSPPLEGKSNRSTAAPRSNESEVPRKPDPIATEDWSASGSDPLGDLLGPSAIADAPLGFPSPLDGAPDALAAANKPSAGVALKRRRWLAKSLVGLAILGLLGAGSWWISTLPSAEEILRLGEERDSAGRYSEAVESYTEFLKRQPDSPRADEIRFRRSLAGFRLRMAPLADEGAALTSGKEALAWSAEIEISPADRASLVETFSRLATSLADRLSGEAEGAGAGSDFAERVDQARLAIRFGRAADKRDGESAGKDWSSLEIRLSRLERQLALAAARDAEIDRADRGEWGSEALLRFPELANDPKLSAARSKASQTWGNGLKFERPNRPAKAGEEKSEAFKGFVFALRRKKPSTSDAPNSTPSRVTLTHARRAGVVYGLDASTGKLLWRRQVDSEDASSPPRLNLGTKGFAILVAPGRRELVCVDVVTGQPAWRQTFGAPLVGSTSLADRIVVTTDKGKVHWLDASGGVELATLDLNQRPAQGPVLDPRSDAVYQLTEEGQVVALSEKEDRCLGTSYLGHVPGAISAPPTIQGRALLVLSALGLRDGQVRFLPLAEDGTFAEPGSTLSLEGHASAAPVLSKDWLFVGVSGNRLAAFRWNAGDPQVVPIPFPMDQAASDVSTAMEPAPWITASEGRIWVAGVGLKEFTISASGDSLAPSRTFFPGEFLTAASIEGPLVVVHRQHASGGLLAAGVDMTSGQVVWETLIGAPGASLVFDSARGKGVLLHPGGGLFEVSLATPIESSIAMDEPTFPLSVPESTDICPVVFENGLIVFSLGAGHDRIVVVDPAQADSPARLTRLPGELASHPIRVGNALLVVLANGVVCAIDPRTGIPQGDPLRLKIGVGSSLRIPAPVIGADGVISLYDGHSNRYRIAQPSAPNGNLRLVDVVAVSPPDSSETESPRVTPSDESWKTPAGELRLSPDGSLTLVEP